MTLSVRLPQFGKQGLGKGVTMTMGYKVECFNCGQIGFGLSEEAAWDDIDHKSGWCLTSFKVAEEGGVGCSSPCEVATIREEKILVCEACECSLDMHDAFGDHCPNCGAPFVANVAIDSPFGEGHRECACGSGLPWVTCQGGGDGNYCG